MVINGRLSGKITVIVIFVIAITFLFLYSNFYDTNKFMVLSEDRGDGYIKWVDFNVSYEALSRAYKLDVEFYNNGSELKWTDMLAYLGAKYGGDFKKYKESDLNNLANRIKDGENIEDITKDMKYYNYYKEAYTVVLGEFVGEKLVYNSDTNNWDTQYGLKAYSPIAKNFPYNHFDDFGNSRTYGYKRKHLGHDMMGQVGTPIIAVESGIVEALGWNKYGGWRIGIRSLDGNRYYYYAHLRKNRPYHSDLYEGKEVRAGDVIGYLGRTGYSNSENQNNIDEPHLHWGMQLIFDESQKDGNGEIWIDLYAITKFLEKNKASVYKKEGTKEYYFEDQVIDIPQYIVDTDPDERVEYDLPIIMYHSILRDPKKSNDYTVTPEMFREDMQYLKDNGYTAITMRDLIEFVDGISDLPEKPVMITFDDGYFNNYYYAYPVLEEFGMKAIISPIAKLTRDFTNEKNENVNWSYITVDDIRSMQDSGIIEFQNHSFNLHSKDMGRRGALRKNGESMEEYKKFIIDDTLSAQSIFENNNLNIPTTYTYPYGARSNDLDEILLDLGFRASLGCEAGINKITRDSNLMNLKRYNRPSGKSSERFFTKIFNKLDN